MGGDEWVEREKLGENVGNYKQREGNPGDIFSRFCDYYLEPFSDIFNLLVFDSNNN